MIPKHQNLCLAKKYFDTLPEDSIHQKCEF